MRSSRANRRSFPSVTVSSDITASVRPGAASVKESARHFRGKRGKRVSYTMLAYNLHTDDRAVARGLVRGGRVGERGRAPAGVF